MEVPSKNEVKSKKEDEAELRRELRRKKILNNAKSRLRKINGQEVGVDALDNNGLFLFRSNKCYDYNPFFRLSTLRRSRNRYF